MGSCKRYRFPRHVSQAVRQILGTGCSGFTYDEHQLILGRMALQISLDPTGVEALRMKISVPFIDGDICACAECIPD